MILRQPPLSVKIFFILLGFLHFSAATLCLGAEEQPSIMGNYLRVIWGLLVVLGVILVLYGLLRKRFSLLSTSTTDNIKVLEVKPLMGKKALCLVEVKGKELLLGISGDNISHLSTISNKGQGSFAETLEQVSTEQPQ